MSSLLPAPILLCLVSWAAGCHEAEATTEAPIAALDIGTDGTSSVDVDRSQGWTIAPPRVMAGVRVAQAVTEMLTLGSGETWGPPLRIDAKPREYIGLHLVVEPPRAAVDLEVLFWNGSEPVVLGLTNWGRGLRVLAVYDPVAPRTYWVRARGSIPRGELSIARTLFEEGPLCESDCDRLLQLPLPLDPDSQGYSIAEGSVYAYQFGRRDLLMALFHAGRRVAEADVPPFAVKRLSRWDGGRPPSHRSHEHGIDVDISLYRSSGESVWFPLCSDQDGRRCVPGTAWDFGADQTALMIAGFLESGLFEGEAAIFIDRAYHTGLRASAASLLETGEISPEIETLFAPQSHLLQHVEPHHHHIHIRVEDRHPSRATHPSSRRDLRMLGSELK